MRYLITGGCGFIGSNLAAEAIRRKDEVAVLDNLYRYGTEQNLAWLKTLGNFDFHKSDIRDAAAVENAVRTFKPDVVFHLAGQVAMTTSLENPRFDFEVNALGTLNVLEAVRKHIPQAVVTFSSTNKVYGDLEDFEYREGRTRYEVAGYENGFGEDLRLDFRTPYGCSKGAADQYMTDYARVFDLNTLVFRHSSVFGTRQFSTVDQGWMGWFIQKALETRKDPSTAYTISGNGKQVRDVLFISDLVDCYFKAVGRAREIRGDVFNLGGGMENSLSLLELFHFLEEEMGIRLNYRPQAWRKSDQKVFVADITKAKKAFDWAPAVRKADGIRKMLDWMKNHGSQN